MPTSCEHCLLKPKIVPGDRDGLGNLASSLSMRQKESIIYPNEHGMTTQWTIVKLNIPYNVKCLLLNVDFFLVIMIIVIAGLKFSWL